MFKSTRPTCINHGCDKPVTHSGTRYRPVCGTCHKIGYSSGDYPFGVMPFRTGKCQNIDSLLGFPCAINYAVAAWAIGLTEIDHIDGNHLNNTPGNAIELCPMCHKKKGMLAGDYKLQDGRYRSAYKEYT